jgi:hypothetical protein
MSSPHFSTRQGGPRRRDTIGRVDELEKIDELAAAMAIPDQGVNLAAEETGLRC